MRASFLSIFHASYVLCVLGYIFIVISDSFLFAREFGLTKNQRRWETMTTYAVGELCILLGCGLSKHGIEEIKLLKSDK
jgi:hypothetical protein